jgi:hypothetical protein
VIEDIEVEDIDVEQRQIRTGRRKRALDMARPRAASRDDIDMRLREIEARILASRTISGHEPRWARGEGAERPGQPRSQTEGASRDSGIPTLLRVRALAKGWAPRKTSTEDQ